MKPANPKNLRNGDLITVVAKPDAASKILEGNRLRVKSVALPFVYVDTYSYHEQQFVKALWHINVGDYDIVRINKNAVAPCKP